mmetsp:Transcript_7683/g.21869  ORF Transcript_7683/g.21869 Transcript_7683/m.21869 type:complete len:222 (+) Transcript_7683:242-907(+)
MGVGGSEEHENFPQLVNIVWHFSLKQWPAEPKLGKNACHRPHVHSAAILASAKEKFRRSIPLSHRSRAHGLVRAAKAACEAKVRKLDHPGRGNEDVARLEIPVEHPARVEEAEALQHHARDALNVRRSQLDTRLARVEDGLQVGGQELQHETHPPLLIAHKDIQQRHQVLVLELPHETYLSEGTERDPFKLVLRGKDLLHGDLQPVAAAGGQAHGPEGSFA